MRKLKLILLLAAFTLAGCSYDSYRTSDIPDGKVPVTISAVKEMPEPDTKVHLNGLDYIWDAGDSFGVFFQGNNEKFDLIGEGGTAKANFKGSLSKGSGRLYVYYPYDDDYWDESDFCFDLSTQRYSKASDFAKYSYMAGVNSNVIVDASSSSVNVSLKSLMAVINVKFNNFRESEIVVESIEIAAKSGEPFVTGGEIDLSALSDSNFPVVNPTTAKSIFLYLGEAGSGMTMAVGEEKTVPFVMAPTTIASQFRIILHYTVDGQSEVSSTTKPAGITFARNKIYSTDITKTGVIITPSSFTEGQGLNGTAE